jgi:hypothetical protein
MRLIKWKRKALPKTPISCSRSTKKSSDHEDPTRSCRKLEDREMFAVCEFQYMFDNNEAIRM